VPSIGHADGNIDVANVGYPIDKVKGSAATTCSVASCHADPYSAATVVTPVWGTTGNGCAACHTGTKVITANGPATGSHTNVTSHAVACITCHAAGTTATAVPSTGHADGNIDVANVGYPLDKVKGSAATTCSAASCHADPYSAGLVTTPVWGTTGNGCAACHTGTKVITATGPATGSHTNTASHAVACITCHAAGTTATSAPSTGHADGNIDVANVGYPIDKVKGSAATTCSTASCHADPYSAATVVTPVWGTTGNGCAACHTGTKVITATGPATGSHALAGHAAACVTCHEVGTTATTAPTVGHNDGNIDTANIGYATLNKTKGSAGTTCSTASCHVSPVSTANVVTPAWGTTGNGCAACHSGVNAITASGPATGSHALHGSVAACAACHATGTTATTAPSSANGHNDGNIDIVNVGYATLNKTKGSAGVSCSTALCHGSSSPAWGVNTTNDSCTKCHGTPTTTGVITAAANNRYLVAPPLNLAKSAGTVTVGEIGQVSSDAKVGAHQTHLRFLNGFSNYSTVDFRCQSCHGTLPTSGTHANGSAAPAFQGLANNRGAMTATYTAVTGTCANTYCHNPAGTGGKLSSANAGTATSPVWTNAAYLDPSAANKTQTNCNKCHLTPADAGFTSTKIHTANITQDCAGCHGHNGETSGEIGKRHLDGIKWGGGDCNTCHGYQAGSWATAPTINAEGKGAHEKHITYLTTKRFTITLSPTTDTYAGLTTAWTNVCGICHGNTAGNHQNNSVNVALDQTYLFGTSPTVAQYNGTPGVSSALTAKTCSNISCHYFTTPVWSTY
jgi:predicted CxxxxCH...CXXCH cytochrome family protein